MLKEPEKKAFELGVRYLSYRNRSAKEIKDYLLKKEFDEKSIKIALEKLQYYGYQNDENFVREIIRQKGEGAGKGRKMIRNHLMDKGVEEGLIERGLREHYPEELEMEVALRETFKFFKSKKKLPLNQIKSKLSQRLASRGFSFEMIKTCLDQLSRSEEVQSIMEEQEAVHFGKALAEGEKVKARGMKKYKDDYRVYGKVYETLVRKGFEKEMIQGVMEQLKQKDIDNQKI